MPLLDTPVRLGVQLQPQHADYASIRDAVREAEEIGVDVVRDSAAGPVLTVSADRELGERVREAGGVSTGPRWLRSLLDA